MKPKPPKQPPSLVGAHYQLMIHTLYWGVVVALFFISLVFSWTLTDGFMAVDLRNRIVGTRVALSGINPYTFQWQAGDQEEWLDPIDLPTNTVSRLSVSPFALLFHVPLSQLDYSQIVRGWFVLQWFLYLSMVVLTLSMADKSQRFSIVMLSAIFAVSPFWLDHLIVGQLYVVLALLSLGVYRILIGKRPALLGLLVAILALLKPNYLLLCLLFGKQKRSWLSFGVTLVVGYSLTVLLFGAPIWNHYKEALGQYATIPRQQMYAFDNPTHVFSVIDNVLNVETSRTLLIPDTSIRHFLEIYSLHLPPWVLSSTYIFLVAALLIYCYRHSLNTSSPYLFFLTLLFLVWLSDFFSPVPRFAYYELQSLALLFLIALKRKFQATPLFIVILVLAYFVWLIHAWLANVLFIIVLLSWFITTFKAHLGKKRNHS